MPFPLPSPLCLSSDGHLPPDTALFSPWVLARSDPLGLGNKKNKWAKMARDSPKRPPPSVVTAQGGCLRNRGRGTKREKPTHNCRFRFGGGAGQTGPLSNNGLVDIIQPC